jgi:hypothetical protein
MQRIWPLIISASSDARKAAATTGAGTRELMSRMGHDSARAALIYQHATRERNQALAMARSELARRRSAANPPRETSFEAVATPPDSSGCSIAARQEVAGGRSRDRVQVGAVETSGLEPPTPACKA